MLIDNYNKHNERTYSFGFNHINAEDVWLCSFGVIPSNLSGILIPEDCKLTSISVKNSKSSTSTITIYKNATAGIPKNEALSDFHFLMLNTSDHVTPITGLTISGKILQDGGVFNPLTNTPVEVSNGIYKIDLTKAEMNADVITLIFIAYGADQRTITIKTSPNP